MFDICSPNGKSGGNLSSGAYALQILLASAHPTAFMGAKWLDSFSGKIKLFQKGEYCHRHRPPIVGISQIDHIIGLNAVWKAFEQWPVPSLQVLAGLIDTPIIVFRVRHSLLDLETIGPCQLVEHRREQLGISYSQRPHSAVHQIFTPPGVVCNQRFQVSHLFWPFPFLCLHFTIPTLEMERQNSYNDTNQKV